MAANSGDCSWCAALGAVDTVHLGDIIANARERVAECSATLRVGKSLLQKILGALLVLSLAACAVAPRAYMANRGSDSVSVINTATNTVIATVPVGISPNGVAVTPNGMFAYVANTTSGTGSPPSTVHGTVSVIDTAANRAGPTRLNTETRLISGTLRV